MKDTDHLTNGELASLLQNSPPEIQAQIRSQLSVPVSKPVGAHTPSAPRRISPPNTLRGMASPVVNKPAISYRAFGVVLALLALSILANAGLVFVLVSVFTK